MSIEVSRILYFVVGLQEALVLVCLNILSVALNLTAVQELIRIRRVQHRVVKHALAPVI